MFNKVFCRIVVVNFLGSSLNNENITYTNDTYELAHQAHIFVLFSLLLLYPKYQHITNEYQEGTGRHIEDLARHDIM